MALAANSQSQVEDALRGILETFKESLTNKQAENFKFTTLPELKASILNLQEEQATERKLKDLTRLNRFLEHMERYDKVMNTFTNSNMYLAFVWGPIRFLLQIAKNYADAFNLLLDSYQQIGETIPQLEQYNVIFHSDPTMRMALLRVYEDIIYFHQKALKYFAGKGWQRLIRTSWKAFNTDFNRLLGSLNRHKELVERQADLIEFEKAEQERVSAAIQCEENHKSETLHRRRFVQQWLNAHDANVDQDDFTKKRTPRTTRWIFETNEVRAWLEDGRGISPLLWLQGILGCGKTIIASSIIEELRSRSDSNTLFFYCHRGDRQCDNFVALARALCFQLLERQGKIEEERFLWHFYEKLATSGEADSLKTRALAEKILEDVLSSVENLYVVIDGLDECGHPEQKAIVNFFRGLVEKMNEDGDNSLHCLFVSQNDSKIRKLLKDVTTVRIRRDDSQKDIKAFVGAESVKIKHKFDLTDGECNSLVKHVAQRADGMFLYAKLVMSNLLDQSRRSTLSKEACYNFLPEDLNDAYAWILNQLKEQGETKFEDVKELLNWVTCSTRPLRWHEIQCGISIDVDNDEVNFVERKFRNDSNELCGSLVEFCDDKTVKLVHDSAREFLEKSATIDMHSEKRRLAELLLRYLCFSGFDYDNTEVDDNDSVSDSDSDSYQAVKDLILDGYFAFMDYSVANWLSHVEDTISILHEDRPIIEYLFQYLDGFCALFCCNVDDIEEKLKNVPKKWKDVRTEAVPQLIPAVNATHAQIRAKGNEAAENSVLKLPKVLRRIRERLEDCHAEYEDLVTQFYGPKVFKCPRMNCFFFYEGFKNAEFRDQHLHKHRKPFLCTFEDCRSAFSGFPSLKELTKHLIQVHHQDPLKDTQFPSLNPSSSTGPSKPSLPSLEAKANSNIKCEECGKTFVRKRILEDHMNASHRKEKPFPCKEPNCNKEFSRENDWKRHVGVHSAEGKAKCEGSYLDEEDQEIKHWGCGKLFARKDSLAAHYRTAKGKRCIQQYNEYMERRRQLNPSAETVDTNRMDTGTSSSSSFQTPSSTSTWASDTTLLNYDQPLIDDVLDGFDLDFLFSMDMDNGVELPPIQMGNTFTGQLPSMDELNSCFTRNL